MINLNVLCAGSILFFNGMALAQVPSGSNPTESLEDIVERLEQDVARLRAQDSDAAINEQRAQEIRAIVEDVLADADSRVNLALAGVTAGYDKGFVLMSSDGNFRLQIGGQFQFRLVYNHQDNAPVDDNRFGFENRRVKIILGGHVVDPSWAYYIESEANRSGGDLNLSEYAWIQKDLGHGLKARFGKFKPMFAREDGISSRKLQTVERSQINSKFGAGAAQGVLVTYDVDRFRLGASMFNGLQTNSQPWSDEDTEWAFAARAEYLALGSRESIEDDVAFKDLPEALLFGAAVAWQMDEFGTGSNLPDPDFNNAETENLSLTADATLKMHGFSIAGAFFYRLLDTDALGLSLDQYGVVVRSGIFLTDSIELYGMYEWGDLDTSADNLNIATIGISKYWSRHALKWQSDVGYAFESVDSSWAVNSAGWRPDSADEDGQIVIRSQLQILF